MSLFWALRNQQRPGHFTRLTRPQKLLPDRVVAFDGGEIELSGIAISAGARLMEVDQARHVGSSLLAPVVDDPKNTFLPDHRFLVAVRDESAQSGGVAGNVDAVDADLTVDVPASCLVLERDASRAAACSHRDVLGRAAEFDGSATVYRGSGEKG